jgi:MerR family transcriptional regulator, copper efflux regulator
MEDAMSNPNALTISKLADCGGVNLTTIRYYERRGLLPKPSRSASGYRLYTDDAVRRLRFIKQAQLLGFSLAEVRDLLSLRMQSDTTCAHIKLRAKGKITAVDRKIADLQRIKSALTSLASACRGKGPTSECPILEALETEDSR